MGSNNRGNCLTKREKELLIWLRYGKNNWDIAKIMNISERTVKFHISNILKKLEATNRTNAVFIAVENGLIEIEKD